LARENFGDKFFSKDELPVSASEDFSFFLHHKPGCFFILGTHVPGSEYKTLHSATMNYNDNMIASGGYFYIKLAEDRLGIKIIKE